MSKKNNNLSEKEITDILTTLDSSEDEFDDFDEPIGCPEENLSYNINWRLDEIQRIQDNEELEESTIQLEPVIPEPMTRENLDVQDEPMESAEGDDHTYNILLNKSRVWSNEPKALGISSVPEPSVIAPTNTYNNRSQPIDYFQHMFIGAIDLLVKNTNSNAVVKKVAHWVDTTNAEISAYLGLLIMMGLHPLSEIDLYWSSDKFYQNPDISSVMTCKRFKKITEAFHVSDDRLMVPRDDPEYDKLNKIRPLVVILNENFKKNATQTNRQCIDESMIKFKGRSTMKQYMPKKPIKRGYKVWARCDSKSGYLYQFQIYTGKSDNLKEQCGLGYRVVTELCEECPENTIVAFDNFFTSLALVEKLSSRKIYSVGTFRLNRKGIPAVICERQKKKEKLLRGEYMIQYCSPIAVIKWRDTKDVLVMTTAYDPKIVNTIERTQKDGSKKSIFCPLPIIKYTETMGGVDRFDHFRSSYAIGRKSKKYWFRFFHFLFESAIINAYILYRNGHVSMNNMHRNFRLKLARSLIGDFSSRIKSAPTYKNKKGGVFGVPEEIRTSNVGVHMPTDGTYRRCRYCSTRASDKRTKIMCTTCNVPLCPSPCFRKFHI